LQPVYASLAVRQLFGRYLFDDRRDQDLLAVFAQTVVASIEVVPHSPHLLQRDFTL
jgi:hypothetical protein